MMMMMMPVAETNALQTLMGCSAPFYRSGDCDGTSGEVEEAVLYYLRELDRLLDVSSKRDIAVALVKVSLCRDTLMASKEASSYLRSMSHRLGIAVSASLSFRLWRDIENALKALVDGSVAQKAVRAATKARGVYRAETQRQQATTSRRLPPQCTGNQTVADKDEAGRAAPRSPLANDASRHPQTQRAPTTADAEVSERNAFRVDVHLKCSQYHHQQIECTRERELEEAVEAAAAAFAVCDEFVAFQSFLEERDALFSKFGVRAAEEAMLQEERNESDRSRVDGTDAESAAASSSLNAVIRLVRHNVAAYLSTSAGDVGAERRRCEPLRLLMNSCSEREFAVYILGSLSCHWTSVHDKLLDLLASTVTEIGVTDLACRCTAAGSQAASFTSRSSSTVGSCVSSASSSSRSTMTVRRKAYHDVLRERGGLPHVVVLSGVRYRQGEISGELDLVVADLMDEQVFLVAEVKASPGDLIKAHEQKSRFLGDVLRVPPYALCSTPKGGEGMSISASGNIVEYRAEQQEQHHQRAVVTHDSEEQGPVVVEGGGGDCDVLVYEGVTINTASTLCAKGPRVSLRGWTFEDGSTADVAFAITPVPPVPPVFALTTAAAAPQKRSRGGELIADDIASASDVTSSRPSVRTSLSTATSSSAASHGSSASKSSKQSTTLVSQTSTIKLHEGWFEAFYTVHREVQAEAPKGESHLTFSKPTQQAEFFVFATTLQYGPTKTPYLSSIAHLVMREIANGVVRGLVPRHSAPAPLPLPPLDAMLQCTCVDLWTQEEVAPLPSCDGHGGHRPLQFANTPHQHRDGCPRLESIWKNDRVRAELAKCTASLRVSFEKERSSKGSRMVPPAAVFEALQASQFRGIVLF